MNFGVIFTLVALLTVTSGMTVAYAGGDDRTSMFEYPPPLHQFKDGISVYAVQCNDPLNLYIRNSETPVCITTSTYELLSENGVDLASPSQMVQQIVEDGIRLYESNGEEAFSMITSKESTRTDYLFVNDVETSMVVAHEAFPDSVGRYSTIFTDNADRPATEIIDDLQSDGSTWVEYMYRNPVTNFVENKASYLALHDGYAFGAGYYFDPEVRVKEAVKASIEIYDMDGSFDRINSLSTKYYPFVIDPETESLVAHGAAADDTVASMIAENFAHYMMAPSHWISDSTIFLAGDHTGEEGGHIQQDLDDHKSTWIGYTFQNPESDTVDYKNKLIYLVLHDGYVFGSGYEFDPGVRVQKVVTDAILLYNANLEDAFEIINESHFPYPIYPFILESDTYNILAHGKDPALVGTNILTTLIPERSLEEIGSSLTNDGNSWEVFRQVVPETNTEEHIVASLVLHDGYVFGAIYDFDPSLITRLVIDDTIQLYENQGEAALEIINSMESTLPLYPFILDPAAGDVAAHGSFADRAELESIILSDGADRPTSEIITALDERGSTWIEYEFINPGTGRLEHKFTMLTAHEGYIFGSGYYLDPILRAQQVVNEGIELYKSEGEGMLEIVNAMDTTRPDYLFVLDLEEKKVVAHAADAGRANTDSLILLDSEFSDRPAEAIIDDLLGEESTWIHYSYTNPLNGFVENKASYLALYDGYIFGSGYYYYPELQDAT